MPRPNARGVDAESLNRLVKAGKGSPVIHARLAWANAESFRRYVEGITNCGSCGHTQEEHGRRP